MEINLVADFEGRGHSKMQGADAPQFRNIQLKWLPSNKLQYIRIAEKIFGQLGFQEYAVVSEV